jgi:hypothetical protein
MKMVDMKRTKEDLKKDKAMIEPETAASVEKYPYGLEIHLEDESISKLGLNLNTFKTGDKVNIQCIADVTELAERSYSGDKKDRRTMRLQITKMALNKGSSDKFSVYHSQQKAGPGE